MYRESDSWKSRTNQSRGYPPFHRIIPNQNEISFGSESNRKWQIQSISIYSTRNLYDWHTDKQIPESCQTKPTRSASSLLRLIFTNQSEKRNHNPDTAQFNTIQKSVSPSDWYSNKSLTDLLYAKNKIYIYTRFINFIRTTRIQCTYNGYHERKMNN